MKWDFSPEWSLNWQIEDQAIEYEPSSICENEPIDKPSLIFTSPFLANSNEILLRDFYDRFSQVASFFPEITGEIKIGLTNSYRGLAVMEFRDKKILRKLSFPALETKGLPSNYVIGHELTHIVQAEKDNIPCTERATDIFTMARLPPRLLDLPPIYLRVPKWIRQNWANRLMQPFLSNLAHDLAIDSLNSRKENHRYIREWESRFEEQANGSH